MPATMRKRDRRLDLPTFPCGHERVPANTKEDECRTCHNARQRAYRARRRAELALPSVGRRSKYIPKRPSYIVAMTPDSTDTAQGALAI